MGRIIPHIVEGIVLARRDMEGMKLGEKVETVARQQPMAAQQSSKKPPC